MTMTAKRRIEFGDFQTPLDLARDVCSLIKTAGFEPASIVEPTCGRGAFLQAALSAFPRACRILGFDLNPEYVHEAKAAACDPRVEIAQGDFFLIDWAKLVDGLREPVLVIGNPPWVTNAVLGSLGSGNLPRKANIDNLRGIDALTGKSNFDISEYMLRQGIEWLSRRQGMLAVLCKTAVARKVLAYAWSKRLSIESASLYRIDAKAHFKASVDACLLVVRSRLGCASKECSDYPSLKAVQPYRVFGLREGELVADVQLYERWRRLMRPGLSGWRSGIKHDCSKVYELEHNAPVFANALGEQVEIEEDIVFPLLKSSDLAAHRKPRKWLLVPQHSMGESPELLRSAAPKTWKYLADHATALDERTSSIYRGRPRFSIFGVGPYTFAPWKVAISGLYKKIDFVRVPPVKDKPVVFDDTCYFFPCDSEDECDALLRLVASDPAREFWSALIFWDSKRPITAKILNSLDLAALAQTTGLGGDAAQTLAERQRIEYAPGVHQSLMFRETATPYGGCEERK